MRNTKKNLVMGKKKAIWNQIKAIILWLIAMILVYYFSGGTMILYPIGIIWNIIMIIKIAKVKSLR
jgi:hypothetical protein